ncbi:SDR family NAD(P)-dependent oxidoreductase [cf. Phormidesmis sp. LEGE 11477]|uniref:SDR family NAD(P)-dependent oxidoreductase n=1 Tax=cf. Phormidesmis sp. LEGE 11477 TaxID=1828680 RepID=UPI00187E6834|nr:SDR family NAD(P)-dependent oxidoreductase [cf. Phormidesmis sp. LEGE 11477]MBE9064652.1 SDR family NAD(P)-dependent oxidoreductase [cf. Phormidesmis sp. LEGE 11477]
MIKTQQRPVAIVTGASSGIGQAIAQHLSNAGYDLALCARRRDRLTAMVKDLEANDSAVLAQTVDLRDEAQILNFFAAVDERFGRLDVLINNAGLGHKEPLMTGSTDAWRETLEVNVLALCICTREAVQRMTPANSGHIVHISSMSGHRVPAIAGIYSATKFAVRSLGETLRRELRAAQSNIRISSVSPGIVETEFAEKYHQSAEKAQETYSQFPVLQADDIAKSVIYLLQQPQHVEVNDILIRPTQQSS